MLLELLVWNLFGLFKLLEYLPEILAHQHETTFI